MVYVDSSKPALVEGFIKNTFTAMIKGVEEKAVSHGLICRSSFKKDIEDFYGTTEPGRGFSYTFLKG